MNDRLRDTLDILQEEAAEIIQVASKMKRFGVDMAWGDGPSNRQKLDQEVGDLLALIDLLIDQGILDKELLDAAKVRKIEKLKVWSTIIV